MVLKDASWHGILASAESGVLKRIYEKVVEGDGFAPDLSSFIDAILDSRNTVAFLDGDTIDYLSNLKPDVPNVKCKISIVSQVNRVQIGFIFPKNSPYIKGISDRFVTVKYLPRSRLKIDYSNIFTPSRNIHPSYILAAYAFLSTHML